MVELQEIEAANLHKRDIGHQKDRTGKKKKKKLKENTTQHQDIEIVSHHDYKDKKSGRVTQRSRKCSISSTQQKNHSSKLIRFVVKFFLVSLFTAFIGVGIISYIVFSNCSKGGIRWIPSSQPFCKDLDTLLTAHKVPNTFWKNFLKTISSLQIIYADKLIKFWRELQKTEFMKSAEEWFYYGYSHIAGVVFFIQKHIAQWFEVISEWYGANLSAFATDLFDNLVIASKMIYAVVFDLVAFMIERGTEMAYSLGSNIVYFLEHREEFYQRLQFWWENWK